jgi:sugar-specific transcriptional regulator TrmB
MKPLKAALQQLGLNTKETEFYLYLLKEGVFTAAQLGKQLGESRTNTYMILARLTDAGLVNPDETSSVKRFMAADPRIIGRLLDEQAAALQRSRKALDQAYPELTAQFEQAQAKREVAVKASFKKYDKLLDEIIGTKQAIEVVGSQDMLQGSDAAALLSFIVSQRSRQGLQTRAVFHVSDEASVHLSKLAAGAEIHISREQPKTGGAIIYGRTTALITGKPKLAVNVMANDALTDTFRQVFNQLWHEGTRFTPSSRKGGEA